jgi:XTP/dITP diphosphohydrolase
VLADLNVTWEQRKAVEKGRSSVLEGIPDQLSAMAKATKVISRVRSRQVGLDLPSAPVSPEQVGSEVLDLVARAQASGIDAEQAVRDAVRELEARVRAAEAAVTP